MTIYDVGSSSSQIPFGSSYASYGSSSYTSQVNGFAVGEVLPPLGEADATLQTGPVQAVQNNTIQINTTTNIFIGLPAQGQLQAGFADGISDLLRGLSAGDVPASQQAVAGLQAGLSAAGTMAGAEPLGLGLGSLLAQLSSAIAGGNPVQALHQIHDFLLGSGRDRGNAFDAMA